MYGYLLVYMTYRYFYILEYGYTALKYGNEVRKWVFVNKRNEEIELEDIKRDWVLCDFDDSAILM